jgi:hypothetical protein
MADDRSLLAPECRGARRDLQFRLRFFCWPFAFQDHLTGTADHLTGILVLDHFTGM